MVGVDTFVLTIFGSSNYTFNACLELILYGYLEIKNSNTTYSRSELLQKTRNLKGSKTTIIELEDYLRNTLVNDHIEPNRCKFNLNNFRFMCGVDELCDNIRTGILDIKVCSSDLRENTYYIFECKRLNKNLVYKYIHEGVLRFTEENKYYPVTSTAFSGMISFLESEVDELRLDEEAAAQIISIYLEKYKDVSRLVKNIARLSLDGCMSETQSLNNIFFSTHNRSLKPPIDIYHILLDYNNIVIT